MSRSTSLASLQCSSFQSEQSMEAVTGGSKIEAAYLLFETKVNTWRIQVTERSHLYTGIYIYMLLRISFHFLSARRLLLPREAVVSNSRAYYYRMRQMIANSPFGPVRQLLAKCLFIFTVFSPRIILRKELPQSRTLDSLSLPIQLRHFYTKPIILFWSSLFSISATSPSIGWLSPQFSASSASLLVRAVIRLSSISYPYCSISSFSWVSTNSCNSSRMAVCPVDSRLLRQKASSSWTAFSQVSCCVLPCFFWLLLKASMLGCRSVLGRRYIDRIFLETQRISLLRQVTICMRIIWCRSWRRGLQRSWPLQRMVRNSLQGSGRCGWSWEVGVCSLITATTFGSISTLSAVSPIRSLKNTNAYRSSSSSASVSCSISSRILRLACFFRALNLSAKGFFQPCRSARFQERTKWRSLRLLETRRLSRWSRHSLRKPKRFSSCCPRSIVKVVEAIVKTCLRISTDIKTRQNCTRLLATISRLRFYPAYRVSLLKILPLRPAYSWRVSTCSFPAFLRPHLVRRVFSWTGLSSQCRRRICSRRDAMGWERVGRRVGVLAGSRRTGLAARPDAIAPSILSYFPRFSSVTRCSLRYFQRKSMRYPSLWWEMYLARVCSSSRPFFFFAYIFRVGTSPRSTRSFQSEVSPYTSSITMGRISGMQQSSCPDCSCICYSILASEQLKTCLSKLSLSWKRSSMMIAQSSCGPTDLAISHKQLREPSRTYTSLFFSKRPSLLMTFWNQRRKRSSGNRRSTFVTVTERRTLLLDFYSYYFPLFSIISIARRGSRTCFLRKKEKSVSYIYSSSSSTSINFLSNFMKFLLMASSDSSSSS